MKPLTTILLSLIFLISGKSQRLEIDKADLHLDTLPGFYFEYKPDTSEAIITYIDTSTCEIELINHYLETVIRRVGDHKIYWLYGYKTEENVLGCNKEPLPKNIIPLSFYYFKWSDK